MTRCGDKVSDRGLATLARFTALEFLSLGELTENGCAALKAALPNCAFRWPEAGPGRRPAVALFER